MLGNNVVLGWKIGSIEPIMAPSEKTAQDNRKTIDDNASQDYTR
jgi:hypothetical protein